VEGEGGRQRWEWQHMMLAILSTVAVTLAVLLALGH
jgi:hypothetical protein